MMAIRKREASHRDRRLRRRGIRGARGRMTAADGDSASEPTGWYDPDAAGFDESLVVEMVRREAAPDRMVATQSPGRAAPAHHGRVESVANSRRRGPTRSRPPSQGWRSDW